MIRERKPQPTDRERLIEYRDRASSLRQLAEVYERQIERLRERERERDREDKRE